MYFFKPLVIKCHQKILIGLFVNDVEINLADLAILKKVTFWTAFVAVQI